jgi:hypothetical protein
MPARRELAAHTTPILRNPMISRLVAAMPCGLIYHWEVAQALRSAREYRGGCF